MNRKEFEILVAEGFERLPQWVRERIKNVALLIEREPSKEDRKREKLSQDETLLGLYKGIPLSERGENYGIGATMPDTITLYKVPIEEAAIEDAMRSDLTARDAVAKIIAETVWHEFAHHFGMNEEDVQDREQKREGNVPMI
ncbi:MAG: metallopeptidase family protein [Rectinemataceae bacterium]|nr:metallopeptidase family protein [Rectinemataceae bacterium]